MSSLTPAVDNSTRYEVWGFLFGPRSGPRRLNVRVSDSDDIRISGTQYLFAPDVEISTTRVEVGMRLYVVFFDLGRHETERENASYVFVRVRPTHLTPVDIRTEDDLQDIIHVLLVVSAQIGYTLPGGWNFHESSQCLKYSIVSYFM
ncbi:hypothetical protein BKA82DRAFT_35379 [Pisolithus tinctorius]|uniref:Uncharacterized protein n=1 Tax=Pisolithus tinctorius Marx 270 TaxID=870435 RepID=A0A0C3J8V3_PISTI|nr:hypothetical protein BKA82DRAFT_35379 [Pisolithus tinctorius]KIN94131.1 hypothetical protein M404DRAFT_35379 [Pisolithus tinctorius Marx 270]